MPKTKINKSYKIGCIICGSIQNLIMIAHRNSNKVIVGWVFVCREDIPKVANKEIDISLS